MDKVHYLIEQKNAHHGRAILQGFKARQAAAAGPLAKDALHLIGGLQHGSLELMEKVLDEGLPYVFFDRAYFAGGPGSNRLRAVPSAYQKHWNERWPEDRSKALGVELRPWRKTGSHILVVPPGPAIRRLFRIEKMWADPLRLVPPTDRRVVVSPKGDHVPLAERLKDCWCVVTWTSNVAVEAVCAGIPVFVAHQSAAAPVGLELHQLSERLESPWLPEHREAWAASLSYGQFSVDEIASGFAAAIVMRHFQ